jgi:tetratricopeptide (TPR) repeat protein
MIDFEQDSQCPKYWDSLDCTFCRSEQYQEALTAFERAIELDHHYTQAWNNRGNALSAMKRFAEAFSSYDRAVAIQFFFGKHVLRSISCNYVD